MHVVVLGCFPPPKSPQRPLTKGGKGRQIDRPNVRSENALWGPPNQPVKMNTKQSPTSSWREH